MLESKRQKKFNQWATSEGWVVRKIRYEGHNGALDCIYIKHSIIVFIEWKKDADSKIQESQKEEIAILNEHKILNIVTHDEETARQFLKTIDAERSRLVTDRWRQVFARAKKMCALGKNGRREDHNGAHRATSVKRSRRD